MQKSGLIDRQDRADHARHQCLYLGTEFARRVSHRFAVGDHPQYLVLDMQQHGRRPTQLTLRDATIIVARCEVRLTQQDKHGGN
ncbi:hypothetical protein QU38_00270, partial [Staphylococcus aureus]